MIDVTERINERFNRARFEIEVKRSVRPLAILAAGGLIGLLAWVFLFSKVGPGLFTAEREVRFAVTDATSVVAGRHDVRIKGIEVGKITKSELVNGKPVLTATIPSKWGKIFRDARAQLRPNTALEDMYLDIVDRGTPAAGEAKGSEPIAASRTDVSVQIEEVLQAFSPDARKHLGGLLVSLGGGLEDRGDELRAAFVKLMPLLQVAGDITGALDVRKQRTERLVADFGTLTDELGRREVQLRRLVSDGGATLQTIASHGVRFDQTLVELPAVLEELDTTSTVLRDVLPDVDRALVALRPAVADLPEGLAGLRGLSKSATPALRALTPSVRQLRPLTATLQPVSKQLARATDALLPQVGAIDHVTDSTAKCTIAVYGFFQWTASVTKFWDSRGTFPRGDAAVSLNAPGGQTRDPNHYTAVGCSGKTPKRDTP